jgi:CheY-like chemotaxis protein
MIMIADASIVVREILNSSLSKAGYQVEEAQDGQEVLEKLQSGLPYELVLCDVEIPKMSGLELLSHIQQDQDLPSVPVVMLSSRSMASQYSKIAIELGARGYFTKPFIEHTLLDATARVIKGEVLVA